MNDQDLFEMANKVMQSLRSSIVKDAIEIAIDALENSTPHPREGDDDYAEQGHREHFAAISFLQEALEELGDQE